MCNTQGCKKHSLSGSRHNSLLLKCATGVNQLNVSFQTTMYCSGNCQGINSQCLLLDTFAVQFRVSLLPNVILAFPRTEQMTLQAMEGKTHSLSGSRHTTLTSADHMGDKRLIVWYQTTTVLLWALEGVQTVGVWFQTHMHNGFLSRVFGWSGSHAVVFR